MIFVDTSVWFAACANDDAAHAQAVGLLARPGTRLVTTDYIIDELLTLLVARRHRAAAREVGSKLFAREICRVIWVTRADVAAARQIFQSFDDKTWSFTDYCQIADCRSRVVSRVACEPPGAKSDRSAQKNWDPVRPAHYAKLMNGPTLDPRHSDRARLPTP